MGIKRNRQVADLIQREVASVIKTTVADPRLAEVNITTVDLSPDLGNARVYYILPQSVERESVSKALKKALGFIRHQVSLRTALRYTPQIQFRYDDSIDHARHLLHLMEKFEA